MKVLYDAQTFLRQRAGGISRLFTDLIVEFDRDLALGVEPEVPFTWTPNTHASQALDYRGIRATPDWLPRGLTYVPWWIRGRTRASGLDLVHHTYYSERFLGDAKGPRRVSTVHDMIPELFAGTEGFTSGHLQKSRYVAESDLVICVSESTKSDMLAIYESVPGQIRVIPNAVRAGFSPEHEPLVGLPLEYLLYVGARAGYKDFALLPQALQVLGSAGIDIPLLVVGKPFTAAETVTLKEHGVIDRVIQRRLSDGDLKRAYANSSLVVQTSRYEGFGLTPLEGMASGVPVVVANASSMPEVGGDVAQYFTAGDAEDLARVIQRVLTDSALRRDLALRGPARARGFSTALMAQRTAEAYREVQE